MSGVASSSITLGFQGLPQKSLNQRPTIALFSCSLVMLPTSRVVAVTRRCRPTSLRKLSDCSRQLRAVRAAAHAAAERALHPTDEGEAELQRNAEHDNSNGDQCQPIAERGQQLGLAQDDGD